MAKTNYTIEDLRNGKVAVEHDGKSFALLRKCMRLAFPGDRLEPSWDYRYYFADRDPLYIGGWYFSNSVPSIPSQRAAAFFK